MQYIMGFIQSKLIDNNLSLDQVLLLKYIIVNANKELTYNKILTDLPILKVKTRQLIRLLEDLKTKGFIDSSKSRRGLIFVICQKCQHIIACDVKNVNTQAVVTCHECQLPKYIYNNKINIDIFYKYLQGGSNNNILELIKVWHTTTNQNIINLPLKNWNRIFDINKLMQELKSCKFGLTLKFDTVVNRYDEIVNGNWRDFKKENNNIIKTHNYTKDELDSLYDDLDNISL